MTGCLVSLLSLGAWTHKLGWGLHEPGPTGEDPQHRGKLHHPVPLAASLSESERASLREKPQLLSKMKKPLSRSPAPHEGNPGLNPRPLGSGFSQVGTWSSKLGPCAL